MKNESSLLYTRHRDIHSVGIVLLQMLLGLDVTERYANVHVALQACAYYHYPSPMRAQLTLLFASIHLPSTSKARSQHAPTFQKDTRLVSYALGRPS